MNSEIIEVPKIIYLWAKYFIRILSKSETAYVGFVNMEKAFGKVARMNIWNVCKKKEC